MTVSDSSNKTVQTGNGSVTQFFYTFRADADADVKVYLDGVLQSSGYTVNRDGDNLGGNVTFSVAPAENVTVTIIRELDLNQETDYTPYSAFPAETHEAALDHTVLLIQQLAEQLERALKVDLTDDGTAALTLPSAVDGRALGWSVVGAAVSLVNLATDDQMIPQQASAPDPNTYPLWYDTTNTALMYWDGLQWQEPGSVDISGKQNRDTDAVAGNLAEFDASGHTVDSGVALAAIATTAALAAAVPSGSKRILDIGQEVTTNTYTSTSTGAVGTRSDEVSVTPKTANSKLLVTASVATYIIQTSSGTCGNATFGGYNNSSELSVQIGNPIGTGQNLTGANSQNSEVTVSFELDQTMLDSSGNWTFKLMGYLNLGNQSNWYAATFDWIEYEDVT